MDFNDVADGFIHANLPGSPSELHGMLCGRISGGQEFDEEELIILVAELLDQERERIEDMGDMLPALYAFSRQQICSDGFEFQPLLPEDDMELNQRLEALGDWCQGFLYGLGNSSISGETELAADIADALRDLAAISQIGMLEDEEDQEDEVSYTELVEYVRVAVLLIYAELGMPEVEQPRTLH
ncbi:UPF0149 family protein [Porticoccus litoralis]|uniref:UPF0149 family protein n=1 Tax=Porticoccus litoralis TaxID=434086 RepID=A0AAW8B2K4_9GAMM|nr:UPF0149 family protein [Porticoccus litoralis]MDP1520637.1 UPF0149 family protein [Porticoccus litoralis]TNE91678.1 MAG: hypothetical protein EP324_04805 [Gammaproteobacteria bacterium]